MLGKRERHKDREAVKRQPNEARNQGAYGVAKSYLRPIYEELQCKGHHGAANGLAGGMEDALTLYRLGVDKELRRILRTWIIIEHFNSHLNASLRRIER